MSGRSGSKLPFWVYAAAERWMQFVGPMGNIYFYDFATGETATDIADIVQRVNPRLRNQKNPRNRRLRSEPAGEPAGEFVEMSAHELASEAIEVLGSGSDAQAIEERAAPRPPRHTMSMSQVIDKAREGAGLKAPDDKVVAEQMADVLKKTFQQVLGASLAAATTLPATQPQRTRPCRTCRCRRMRLCALLPPRAHAPAAPAALAPVAGGER